ncbi:MAG: hypothetical protein ACFFDN_05230 [Candidatus Hodarchaeota archaeon]
MPFIIETIGKWGVKTSELNHIRLTHPQPGDPILMPDGSIARVDDVNSKSIGVCLHTSSVFLCESGKVSISGGPFESINLDDIEYTGELKNVIFWNWGDHLPGAHQGVYYHITRPLFKCISKN